jgi:Na+/melibiose symporter-like transporter
MARWFKSLGGIFMENQTVSSKLPKLSFLKMFGYGTGDFAQNLIYNTVSTYLLFFYTNVYGLNPASAATMFLVVRVIDAINDPSWAQLLTNIRTGSVSIVVGCFTWRSPLQ